MYSELARGTSKALLKSAHRPIRKMALLKAHTHIGHRPHHQNLKNPYKKHGNFNSPWPA